MFIYIHILSYEHLTFFFQYFVLCSFLSLSANVLFLQIKYIVKILLMTVTLIVFDILFHTYTIFQTEGAWQY